MSLIFFSVAVARRDAGVERTGTYSQRATERNIEIMSGTEVNPFHARFFVKEPLINYGYALRESVGRRC